MSFAHARLFQHFQMSTSLFILKRLFSYTRSVHIQTFLLQIHTTLFHIYTLYLIHMNSTPMNLAYIRVQSLWAYVSVFCICTFLFTFSHVYVSFHIHTSLFQIHTTLFDIYTFHLTHEFNTNVISHIYDFSKYTYVSVHIHKLPLTNMNPIPIILSLLDVTSLSHIYVSFADTYVSFPHMDVSVD